MNEAIEYAEMLEIPVSTVNVVHKKRGRKRKTERGKPTDVKESLIAQINNRVSTEPTQGAEITADAEAFAEGANSQGDVRFDVPERIDTVRLYSAYDKPFLGDGKLRPREYPLDGEEDLEEEPYLLRTPARKAGRGARIALGIEFTACCALCGAIFLTNVFMPGSAINTFFRFLGDPSSKTDARTYTDFTLSPVVSTVTDTELTLSDTGVLTFKNACHVYPAVDGTVSSVVKTDAGYYTVKIAHSDSFTEVIEGLQYVYYTDGDTVKANVPVGYTNGETDVQVTMYSFGELLNCFELTEENCLAWITQEQVQ